MYMYKKQSNFQRHKNVFWSQNFDTHGPVGLPLVSVTI